MPTLKIYTRKESELNDATKYYVGIIAKAFEERGFDIVYTHKVKDINKKDFVLIITPRSFFKTLFRKRKYSIYWFQGIITSEIPLYNFNRLISLFKIIISTIVEYITLKKSNFIFFVSDDMVDFYKRNRNYKKNNYLVMPCFNQKLEPSAFNDKKYSKPTFVYAGNLAGWQCFSQTIQLFKKIKERIPEAELTIYTKEQEEANLILDKYQVNATVKYVPYQELNNELQQYKYGFIIREDIDVNNVATPTKMNSYMAVGIIPIYTNVVGAFKKNLNHLEYAVPLNISTQKVYADKLDLQKLYDLENKKIKAEDVLNEYNKTFETFYSKEYYIEKMRKMFQ